VPGARRCAERAFGDDQAVGRDRLGQRPVRRRIDNVDAGADDRDRRGTRRRRRERAAMGRGVDAERESARDRPTAAGEMGGKLRRVLAALACGIAAADDRERGSSEQFAPAAAVENGRRIVDFEQCGRVAGVGERDQGVPRTSIEPRQRPLDLAADGRIDLGREALGERLGNDAPQLLERGIEDRRRQAERGEQRTDFAAARAVGQRQAEPGRKFVFAAWRRGDVGRGCQLAATSAAATSAPATSAPATSAPATSAPVTSAPVTSAPVISARPYRPRSPVPVPAR
jgi:hypothetical protein